ncbi:hypothetical protein ACXR0O_27335 [Verrucomicrobiota bacterium sgz303538]
MRIEASRAEPFTAAHLSMLEKPSPIVADEAATTPKQVRSRKMVMRLTVMKALAVAAVCDRLRAGGLREEKMIV